MGAVPSASLCSTMAARWARRRAARGGGVQGLSGVLGAQASVLPVQPEPLVKTHSTPSRSAAAPFRAALSACLSLLLHPCRVSAATRVKLR
eukprot:CAMPEP_0206234424 /NCGR_PEP_ID=MMETSP0047_2-20121206/12585_1 /ASSEMBLY_ACC=CAM_ASM_000192 /TAXON_ID=195065 /ORGANISM="Chroomonas mesostigmatica_cf, Strain CCMP1168" /LENGTH=90 /DNA_ID=CAMNT_0053658513 /DNA_START=66 /DNA_END=335 /DNA_ORIENTATION=+